MSRVTEYDRVGGGGCDVFCRIFIAQLSARQRCSVERSIHSNKHGTMSLATVNSPSLVAAAGVGTYLLLPILEKAIENGALSWTACKAANACAYAVNFMATSVPGRLDGGAQNEHQNDKKKNQKPSKEMEPISTGRRGRTLVAPAGW